MPGNGAIQGVDIATLGDAKLGSLNDCFMESADKCAEQQLIFNHLFLFLGNINAASFSDTVPQTQNETSNFA